MAVLRTFKSCVSKPSLTCHTVIEEETSSEPSEDVRILIRYFVGVTQVLAGGVSRPTHDSCTHCGLPVFLAERLLVGSKRARYHRTCFRCARCTAQLTLANCYETEDGGFCCETCPDEELDKSDTSSQGTDRVDMFDSKSESICSAEASQKPVHYNISLSDDEKSLESHQIEASDDYSALFESTVESFQKRKFEAQPTTGKAPLAPVQQAPYDLLSKSDDSSQKSLQNSTVNSNSNEGSTGSKPLDQCDELSLCQPTKDVTKPLHKELVESEETLSDIKQQHSESDAHAKINVHSLSISSDSSVNQPPVSVSAEHSEVNNCTKDSKISNAGSSASIVKIRKKMFEGENTNAVVNPIPFRKSSLAYRSKPEGVYGIQEKESKPQENRIKNSEVEKGESPLDAVCTGFRKPSEDETLEEQGGVVLHKIEESEHSKSLSQSSVLSGKIEKCSEDKFETEEETASVGNDFGAKFHKDVTEKEKVDTDTSVPPLHVRPSVSPRKLLMPPKPLPMELTPNEEITYPTELNPFDEEEAEEATEPGKIGGRKESTNPFGSSDEDEPVVLRRRSLPDKPPRPPPPLLISKGGLDDGRPATMALVPSVSPVPAQRRVIPAPANLNPFWSDGEEPEEEDNSTPKPLPRTIRLTPEPSPRPRTAVGGASRMMSSSGKFGSSSSVSSMASNTGTNRRSKKPAPAPPSLTIGSSLPPSPNLSVRSPHKRKSRPAPQPPTAVPDEVVAKSASLDGWKLKKDEANRSQQAVDKEEPTMPRDKSTFGQWKRKKGPAPPRPLPQRRQVRAMPVKELKRELGDIEVKQLELERQGVKLEQTIRHKFDEAPSLNESSMTPDVEDLVIQLFELVNEKNELFRKQAELMYLRRQQRLEEEHAELEYQIRCLMEQPERNKTDIIKAREEELIQRLVEVVERRNEIIECLEMDRIREAEEDRSIHTRLGLFAAKNAKDLQEPPPSKRKKEKKKKKEKDSKKKKDPKVDADKDIDEVEAAAAAAAKEKKSKKKWF